MEPIHICTATLAEIVTKFDELEDLATLFVRRPWTASSECAVILFENGISQVKFTAPAGLEYFLEIHVALEALEVFTGPPTLQQSVDLLVFYAENDAFPEWAFEV